MIITKQKKKALEEVGIIPLSTYLNMDRNMFLIRFNNEEEVEKAAKVVEEVGLMDADLFVSEMKSETDYFGFPYENMGDICGDANRCYMFPDETITAEDLIENLETLIIKLKHCKRRK